MRLRQYVYFALKSEEVSAAEITARLGVEPDEVVVRGSRQTDRFVRPVCHIWKIVCREPNMRLSEAHSRWAGRRRVRVLTAGRAQHRTTTPQGRSHF